MAPRGKKKAVISPQKQLCIKEFMSIRNDESPTKKRKPKDGTEKDGEGERNREGATLRSPRKKQRKGAENNNNNNNNNNNEEEEDDDVVLINNNNNNERTPTPEKKKQATKGRTTLMKDKSPTRVTRASPPKEREEIVLEDDDDEEEEEEDADDPEIEELPPMTRMSDDDDDSDIEEMTEEGRPVTTPNQGGSQGTPNAGADFTSFASRGTRILQTTPQPPKEQKNTFKCKVCEEWFPNRYFQRKHMLMEHENQLYECRVCNFNSVNPEKLKSHIIKQHVIKKERNEAVSLDEIKVDLDELITKHTPRKVMMEDGVVLGRDATNKMRYICAMCDRVYTSKYSLERHVRCHTGEKPYVCDVCNFSTSYREHMMRHMTSVHLIVHSDEPRQKYIPKNRRRTEEKNVSTEDPEIVEIPDKDEKEEVEEVEAEGEEVAKDDKEIENEHELIPPAPVKKRRNILRKRFECAACGLKATHKTDLVNHIKEKHPNAHIESLDNGDGSKVHLIVTMLKKPAVSRRMVITCSECSKVFHDTWKYKVHMRSHTGVKPFGCNLCSFFATSKMTVRDHIHRKHKGAENPRILLRTLGIDGTVSHVELNMPQREFKCDHCGEVFDDNYHMKHHKKKAHTDVAPFSCVQCSHREWARANIIIHCLQTHNDKNIDGMIMRNGKPFNVGPLKLPKCHQCDKLFPYVSQLSIHMKQHTGERSYFCELCNYRTNSKVALEKHILRHLEGNPTKKPTPARKRNTKKKEDKEDKEDEIINFVDVDALDKQTDDNPKARKKNESKRNDDGDDDDDDE